MSEYFFGLHQHHLTAKADQIAKRHGAVHVNFTEPNGQKRGWFSGPNRGSPFDRQLSEAVMADIDAVGGFGALTRKR